jgi:hypothetical protein
MRHKMPLLMAANINLIGANDTNPDFLMINQCNIIIL